MMRLGAPLAILAALSGCTRADFVADAAPARPLTQFNRIDVRALANQVPPREADPDQPAASPDRFLAGFRKDLTARLQRRKVLNLSSGPMLVLDAALVRYHCESRKPTHAKDMMTKKAFVEVQVVLSDETGNRIGSGKASIEYLGQTQDGAMSGAEARIMRAIASYLRRSAKASEPDVPDPDDP